MGEGCSVPDITTSVNGTSATSSSRSVTSGSLLTPVASAILINPEYDVRRHLMSMPRSNRRVASSDGAGWPAIAGAGAMTDSSTVGPPAACHC